MQTAAKPKVVLMTDSASDIAREAERAYGIKIICFEHVFAGKTYKSRVDFDNQKYYEMLEQFDGIPATSQVTPYEFERIYEKQLQDGCAELIYVSINSKGSATHANAILAREQFYQAHPQARTGMKIHIIDGKTYTCGYGYAVVEAAKMLQNGVSAGQTAAYIQDWCDHCQIYFVPYTLKYAAKSGRINGAAAFLGNALGIKPLMVIENQAINVAAKTRGEKNAVKAVIENSAAAMKPGSPYCLVYGNNPQDCETVRAAMVQKVGYEPAMVCQIGAEIAANAGPKAGGRGFLSGIE